MGMEMKNKKEENVKNEKNVNNGTHISRSELPALGFLLIVSLVSLIAINSLNPFLYWDENVYSGNARSHLGESNFTEDFRFPLIEYIIAGVWFFTGESVFVARLIIILFSVSSILLFYLIAREYFSKDFSFFLCVLFAFCPLMLLWGFRIGTDISAMFFISLSFYLLLKGENKMTFTAFAGAFAAVSFLVRFSSGLFALSVLIYFIFKRKPKELIIFTVFFLAALSPWLAYNQVTYGNPVWDLQMQYSVVAEWTYPEPFAKQLVNFFVFTNILIPLLFVFGIYYLLKYRKFNSKLKLLILIYLIVSFTIYFFFVNLKEERYYLMFLPFIYIISFRGLLWLGSNQRKIFRWALTALIVVFIVQSLFVFSYIYSKNYCDSNNSIMKSVSYLEDKVGKNDVILTNVIPWVGYNLNAKTHCLCDMTAPLEMHNFTYVVYNDREGSRYDLEILDNSSILKLEKTFTSGCSENTYIYKRIKK